MTAQNGFRARDYLAPRFWPTWLGLGTLRLLHLLLPFRWQLKLGYAIGDLAYRLLRQRRAVVLTNLRLCLPELSDAQREQLARKVVRNTFAGVFETAYGWWTPANKLHPLLELEGLEHIEAALAENRGAILLGGHFTCMLLCGRLLALRLPFHILVKPAKNALYESLMRHYRERDYAGVINTSDLRGMVRKLKAGEVVWYSPDQDLGHQNSVFAPFMGVETATITATARLAKLSGAPIVPIMFARKDDDSGYRLRILPAWNDFPSGDDQADATRVNQFIEDSARQALEQYFWVHKRFKSRPQGEANVY